MSALVDETFDGAPTPPLADIKVIDIATLFAGPFAAQLLADFGADVVRSSTRKAIRCAATARRATPCR